MQEIAPFDGGGVGGPKTNISPKNPPVFGRFLVFLGIIILYHLLLFLL